MSTAWTTPYDVSIARMPSASCAEGALSAPCSAALIRWTWLFQNPAVTVPHVQSITVAPGGTATSARRPTP